MWAVDSYAPLLTLNITKLFFWFKVSNIYTYMFFVLRIFMSTLKLKSRDIHKKYQD